MKINNQAPYQVYAIYFIFSFIVLYFTYASLVHIPFYHHDIYKFSVGGVDKLCKEDYGYDNMLIFVRPLVALFDCGNFKLGSTLHNMSYLRLKCIVLACLFASFIGLWLYRRGISFWISIIIGTLIFCLPGIQTAMIMGTDALIAAPFFAFLSALLIDKGFSSTFSLKQSFLIVVGFICLFGSFLTYIAESGFFLLPALTLILFQPLSSWQSSRKVVVRDIAIFIFSTILFFFIAKFVQHRMMTSSFPSNYVFNVNFMLGERIVGLIKVFPSLWSINYSSLSQAVIIYLIVTIALIAAVKMYRNDIIKSSNSVGQLVLCTLIILFLSSITYLAQPTNMVFTRILFAFQVMGMLIVIWSIKTITHFFQSKTDEIFLGVMGGLLLIGAIYSNVIVTYSALNDNMEFNYLVSTLHKELLHHKSIQRIHLVGLPYGSEDNFNGRKQRDDIYNVNSLVYRQDSFYMVDAALKQFVLPHTYSLFNCALDEFQLKNITETQCIQKAPQNSIIVTYSRQHEPINKTPNMLLIDMSADKVYFPNYPKHILMSH